MVKKYYMTWSEVVERLQAIDSFTNIVYGVPRGGMICSAFLQRAHVTYNPMEANVILDDIIDSGRTEQKWKEKFPNVPFFGMVDKIKNQTDKDLGWIVFPWENDKEEDIEDNVVRLLEHYGIPVNDSNSSMLKDFLSDLSEISIENERYNKEKGK